MSVTLYHGTISITLSVIPYLLLFIREHFGPGALIYSLGHTHDLCFPDAMSLGPGPLNDLHDAMGARNSSSAS